MPKTRKPTPEEIALFRRAAGDVRALLDDRTHHAPPRRPARPRTPEREPRIDRLPDAPHAQGPESLERGDALSFTRPGVQRRTATRLRRGQLAVESDLDLHGMTVAEARPALERFLTDSARRGRRCVRIVHGKGIGSPAGRPTLKSHVERWLRLSPDVLAFSSATVPDGGTGALYVLIRSSRD